MAQSLLQARHPRAGWPRQRSARSMTMPPPRCATRRSGPGRRSPTEGLLGRNQASIAVDFAARIRTSHREPTLRRLLPSVAQRCTGIRRGAWPPHVAAPHNRRGGGGPIALNAATPEAPVDDKGWLELGPTRSPPAVRSHRQCVRDSLSRNGARAASADAKRGPTEEIAPGQGAPRRGARVITELRYQLSKAADREAAIGKTTARSVGIADIRDEATASGSAWWWECAANGPRIPKRCLGELQRRTASAEQFRRDLLALVDGQHAPASACASCSSTSE